jgi:protein-S-isoprenylcysteine O-methyltransferase Ste14
MEYLVLILLWSIWCAVHSGMISLTITVYLKKRLGDYYRFYRPFYNLVSLITLIPLVLYNASPKGQVLFRWEGYMMIFQFFLMMTVLLLFISGGMKYDMLRLFGIRQIKSGESHSTLSETGAIDTSGVLGLTRHPWYLGAIIFVWIDYREMYVSTLIVSVILTVYLVIGTVLEERKLIIQCGDNYRDYKEGVSMLFPFKWISSKLMNLVIKV